jgi:hypothetical protein
LYHVRNFDKFLIFSYLFFSGLQFLEWFHQVEGQLQRRDDAHIRVGVRSLERLFQESTLLVEQTEEGLKNIEVLRNQYKVRVSLQQKCPN